MRAMQPFICPKGASIYDVHTEGGRPEGGLAQKKM